MRLQKPKLLTAALALGVALSAQQALAISVLTFDSELAGSSTFNALGFSVTNAGAADVATVDFAQYDVIYLSMTMEEFFSSGLFSGLSARGSELEAYIASGGGLVFGSPDVGIGLPGGTATDPLHPIVEGIDPSNLGLVPLFQVPGADAVVVNGENLPLILAGEYGDGRIVGWVPDPFSETDGPTETGIVLAGNSIEWAAGQPPAVPEPGTLALMGLGAALLAGTALRRKR